MAALEAVAPLLGATAKKSSGSSSILIIYVAIAAGFYFLIYRPRQRKAKALRAETKGFDVGDEVLTAGGIVGHIIDIDGDRVTMETSVGASFVVLKQYVLRKLEEPVDSGVDDDETYGDDQADDFEDDQDHEEADSTEDDDHDDDGLSGADGSSSEDHPSGQEGTSGQSTKADSGDDNGGPDGPPAI